MQKNTHQEPNSIKIMDKLKQIKRIFNQGESIYASNPTAIQSQHQGSIYSENEKLRKYLPQPASMRREQQIQQIVQIGPIIDMRHNDHNLFKKQLQSKIQTLFNEQKSLLRNRYDINDQDDYFRERKGKRFKIQKGNERQSIMAMDKKVKELQKKYLNANSTKQKNSKQRQKDKETNKNKSFFKDKDTKDNSQQINELKRSLYQTKLLNQRLSNKLLKQKQKKQLAKELQMRKLSQQLNLLKDQMQKMKSIQKTPYVVCPARVKARNKSISTFISNQKMVEHSILTEVYGQIDDLQSRLNREQRQKLDLNEKNHWLQSQLQKFVN